MLQSLFRGLVSGMLLLLSPLLSDFSGLLPADYPGMDAPTFLFTVSSK